jgi:hypothetical protein
MASTGVAPIPALSRTTGPFQREGATRRTRVQNVANPDLSVDISSGRAMGRLYARILDTEEEGAERTRVLRVFFRSVTPSAPVASTIHLSRALLMTRERFADLLRSGYH